jgi:hypothetical protein
MVTDALNVAEIERRAASLVQSPRLHTHGLATQRVLEVDVPALVAEVRRLRGELDDCARDYREAYTRHIRAIDLLIEVQDWPHLTPLDPGLCDRIDTFLDADTDGR